MTDESPLPPELAALEARLTRLTPQSMDREAFLMAAGEARAAQRYRRQLRLWQSGTALAMAASLALFFTRPALVIPGHEDTSTIALHADIPADKIQPVRRLDMTESFRTLPANFGGLCAPEDMLPLGQLQKKMFQGEQL